MTPKERARAQLAAATSAKASPPTTIKAPATRTHVKATLTKGTVDPRPPTPAELAAAAVQTGNMDPEYINLLDRAAVGVNPFLDKNNALAPTKPSQDARPMGESFADMRVRPMAKHEWLAQDLIGASGVFAIAAEPKSTKSWLAIDLAVSIASGTRALGRFEVTAPAGVFYMFAEDHEASVRARIAAIAAGKGLAPDGDWTRRLFVQAAGRKLDLTQGFDLCVLIASVWYREAKSGVKVRALILDPLSDIHSGQEDKRDSMRPILSMLRVIARQILDCTLVFVHHSSKPGADGKTRKRGGARMRGSSAIHGAIDGGIYLDEPRGDRKAEFINRIESETRTGRSAGTFDLTLRVEDDANGLAVRATHECSERAREESSAQLVDQRAVTVVQKLFDQGGPMTFDQLFSKIRGDRNVLMASIKIASEASWIEQRFHKGRKAGYQVTEAGKELIRGASPRRGNAEPESVPSVSGPTTGYLASLLGTRSRPGEI